MFDALARWRKAMAQGLTSEQAAKAVGVPRATLYRWRERAEPISRRPVCVSHSARRGSLAPSSDCVSTILCGARKNAGRHSSHKPARLAHFNDNYQSAS